MLKLVFYVLLEITHKAEATDSNTADVTKLLALRKFFNLYEIHIFIYYCDVSNRMTCTAHDIGFES